MSKLREAAQAVVTEFDDWGNTEEDMERAIDRLRAALAKPETESEPDPPRDEWRPASEPPEQESNDAN